MGKLKITINDILQRDLFKSAELIAGDSGRDRVIKWTHIFELDSYESFINGGELILTTGTSLAFDSPKGIPNIKRIIDSKVAGICVELGTHLNEVHPDIIALANQNDFPIIIFKETVKFVDITLDLHTTITNVHYEQLNYLHLLSNEFNKLSLEPNGILKILTRIHKHFNKTVLLLTDEKKLYYYPMKEQEHVEKIHSLFKAGQTIDPYASDTLDNKQYSNFPIKGLGHSWGNLYFQESAEIIDEFSFSILDRATIAIAQILLRDQTIEERKQNHEEDVVQKLIHGESYASSVAENILPAPAENLYYRLIILENKPTNIIPEDENWEEIKLRQVMILRSLFKKHGFFPAISSTKNNIAIIASFYKSSEPSKGVDIFTTVTEAIRQIQEKNIFLGENYYMSTSSLQKDYRKLATSLNEAKEVISLQKLKISNVTHYEDIGVYRLLMKLSKPELENYITVYLGPLLDADIEEKTKHDLLETLTVYLDTMGSKKLTSDRLFIVRQTLYHRLQKIEELMGENFMESTNRQAIELAIKAYALIEM